MRIIDIGKGFHGAGVLAGKPCVTIELAPFGVHGPGTAMKPEDVVAKALEFGCSFFEFVGDDPAGKANRQEVGAAFLGLRDGCRHAFVAAETPATSRTEIPFDFITVVPDVRFGSDRDAMDHYFRLDTKLQVKIELKNLQDMKATEEFLRRHFLIRKRRIPLIFVAEGDIPDLTLEWGFVRDYNWRVFA